MMAILSDVHLMFMVDSLHPLGVRILSIDLLRAVYADAYRGSHRPGVRKLATSKIGCAVGCGGRFRNSLNYHMMVRIYDISCSAPPALDLILA
jgi:hypothetical protein